MIEYVSMCDSHVAAVAQLEKLCFSMPWSEKSIRSELDNPLSLWLVAVDGEKLAGYVGSQAVMGEADMMNLAVVPEYRCQGIGEQLVLRLIQALMDQKVSALSLEVRVSNQSALHLYEKLGFSAVGRRPGYYRYPREDALILRKEWQS